MSQHRIGDMSTVHCSVAPNSSELLLGPHWYCPNPYVFLKKVPKYWVTLLRWSWMTTCGELWSAIWHKILWRDLLLGRRGRSWWLRSTLSGGRSSLRGSWAGGMLMIFWIRTIHRQRPGVLLLPGSGLHWGTQTVPGWVNFSWGHWKGRF